MFGYYPYVVLSGSMEPLYQTGSMVYVEEVTAEEIEVGDVITFYMIDNATIVTHQVIEIDEINGYYYTQGLANETADGLPTTIESIIGKSSFSIPYLGFIVAYLTTPPWSYILIGLVLMWMIGVHMIDLWEKDKKENMNQLNRKDLKVY